MLLLRRNEQRLTFGSGSDPDQDQPSAALVSSSTDEHPAIKREQPVTTDEQAASFLASAFELIGCCVLGVRILLDRSALLRPMRECRYSQPI
jgi:hypothetical protein